MKLPNSWNKGKNHPLYPQAEEFYQKTWKFGEQMVVAEMIAYKPISGRIETWSYELHIQIPKTIGIISGLTMNVNLFPYKTKKLDWKEIEKQCEKIINLLVDKKKISN